MMRSCYATTMQFDDTGDLTAEIQWYFANDGAVSFPAFAQFGSKNWLRTGFDYVGPGEVWNATRSYSKGAAKFFAPGNGSFCGQLDWWENGCPSDAPPISYSSQQIPVCCPQQGCCSWYDGGTGHRTISTPGQPYVWTKVSENFAEVLFEDAATGYKVQLEPRSFHCVPGDNGALACGLEVSLTLSFPLSLWSYDPNTYTSEWRLPPGETHPAGFVLYAVVPPH